MVSVSEAKPEHFISFSNLEASTSFVGLILQRRAASAEIKAQHVIRETVQPVDYRDYDIFEVVCIADRLLVEQTHLLTGGNNVLNRHKKIINK